MRRARNLAVLATVAALTLHAGTSESTPVKYFPLVVLKATPPGVRCLVGREELNCPDVAAHLRDRLKFPPGHLVVVKADSAAKSELVRALFDSLEAAGFSVQTGVLVE